MTQEKAEEFLLKLLLGRPETITKIQYYWDQKVWRISQRIRGSRDPGTAYHELKLPVTDKEFEKLLELFGVNIIDDISSIDWDSMSLLWYDGRCIGYYKSYEVLSHIEIKATINLHP